MKFGLSALGRDIAVNTELNSDQELRLPMDKQYGKYSSSYSDKSLWKKIKNVAVAAGVGVIEKVLILYYCLNDSDTPTWAKAVIVSALGYFIAPLDAIPDIAPLAGYTDDLGALGYAFMMVTMHIKEEHKAKAKAQMKVWFG
ncbi:MAG: YkvA family protein [Elainellaceae cyanobacterium]